VAQLAWGDLWEEAFEWQIGGGADTVPFLVDSFLLASQTLFLYTFSFFFFYKV
jgi:hypothetical protein